MDVLAPSRLDRLDQLRALAEAATATFLEGVAELDEAPLWRADGATCMTGWLRARHAVKRETASEWVRVAHALRRLPRIRAAYAEARLSWDQLRPLTRFATPDSDEELAETAPRRSAGSLQHEADRHRKVERRESQRKHRQRYLEWWRDDERFLHLQGMLPPDQAAVVEKALRRRAEQIEVEEGLADPGGARMADAFVEMAAGGRSDRPALRRGDPADRVRCQGGVGARVRRSPGWDREAGTDGAAVHPAPAPPTLPSELGARFFPLTKPPIPDTSRTPPERGGR